MRPGREGARTARDCERERARVELDFFGDAAARTDLDLPPVDEDFRRDLPAARLREAFFLAMGATLQTRIARTTV